MTRPGTPGDVDAAGVAVDREALRRNIVVALRAPLMALYADRYGFHDAKRNTDRVSREVAEDAMAGLVVQDAADRDALGKVISESRYALCEHNQHEPCSDCIADRVLASGVLTDAAQVRAQARREVAEEIAAKIEADLPAVDNALGRALIARAGAARIVRAAADPEGPS